MHDPARTLVYGKKWFTSSFAPTACATTSTLLRSLKVTYAQPANDRAGYSNSPLRQSLAACWKSRAVRFNDCAVFAACCARTDVACSACLA